ncbi:MAG: hypothetical protein ABJ387_03465 [Balneola sp.]
MPPIYYNDAWEIAAAFDAAGNVVQFNLLIVGETGSEVEPINQEHTTGDYQSGEMNRVMIDSPDFEGADQVAAWKLARTPLKIVAVSKEPYGRNYVWPQFTKAKQATPITKPKVEDGDASVKITLEHAAVEPKRVRNLIFGEAGNSLDLPLSGITLTLAAEKASAFDLELEAFDYGTDGTDGSSLGSASDSFDDERGSVSLQLPSNTWRVEWTLNGATDASLRADGSSEYIAG